MYYGMARGTKLGASGTLLAAMTLRATVLSRLSLLLHSLQNELMARLLAPRASHGAGSSLRPSRQFQTDLEAT